jgi:hypothetical protein
MLQKRIKVNVDIPATRLDLIAFSEAKTQRATKHYRMSLAKITRYHAINIKTMSE